MESGAFGDPRHALGAARGNGIYGPRGGPDGTRVRIPRVSHPTRPAAAPPRRRALLALALIALALLSLAPIAIALPARPAGAQSLRGSRASVDRAYATAHARGLAFHRTRRTIERDAARGVYVRLLNTPTYRLRGVGVPYLLPTTRATLAELALRYRRQCGERLVVTSGMRLTVNRLLNGTPKSVHPTGLAFDLRAPRGRCRSWIRRELLALERRGVVDATEERFPPHLHVVVYRTP